jgi:hypothetical protein
VEISEGVIKMKNILYPDSGNPLEDASVLRNAVYFSTAERVYAAQLILQQPLKVTQTTLNFLVVKAFEEFMTATEDMIGWLFALKEWQPGNAEFSLFLLLDRITVGKGDYKEERAVSLLSEVDDEGFRELLHIPKDEDLIASGVSQKVVDKIGGSIRFKLDGWRKTAEKRMEQKRGWVRMFNKFKHHMLAFPTRDRNKAEIWLPTRIIFNKVRNHIVLSEGRLDASANELRRLAGDAIAVQAVLHDTLAMILSTRYGEKYVAPQWAIKASQTDYLWA